jgi:hypothetical protein
VIADPPGYCRAQQKYLTDDEFIRLAVSLLEKDMERTVTVVDPAGNRTERENRDFRYGDWDFDKNNPNCCLVLRGETQSIYNRMLGEQRIEVRLNPKTSTFRVDLLGDSFGAVFFDTCGNFIPSDFDLF